MAELIWIYSVYIRLVTAASALEHQNFSGAFGGEKALLNPKEGILMSDFQSHTNILLSERPKRSFLDTENTNFVFLLNEKLSNHLS